MTRLVDKRTKKLDKEDVKNLWQLIDYSRTHITNKDFFERCKELRALLKTGTLGELDYIEPQYQVKANLAHAHISTFIPSVFFTEPDNICTPTHPRHDGKEKTWRAVLNFTQKKTGLKKQVGKAVLDAAVYPEGWVKHFINQAADSEEVETGESTRGKKDIVGPLTEDSGEVGPTEWITKGAPAVARLAPFQVVVDYLSHDRSPENARFIDIMYRKTLSDLKDDPRYSVKAKNIDQDKSFTGGKPTITKGYIDPFGLADGDDVIKVMGSEQDHFIILHEVWVYQLSQFKLYKQLVCLVEGIDGLIMDEPVRELTGWEEVLDGMDEYPVDRLVFNEIPDDLPNSELGVWSGMLSAVNWLLTRLTQFVDNQKQIFEVDKSKLIDAEKARLQFEKGGPRTWIEVNGIGAINPIQNHLSTRDDTVLLNLLFELIRRVSGQSENLQGGDKFRTATAAAVSSRSSQAKSGFDVDTVAEFLKSISIKQAKLIKRIAQSEASTKFVFNIAGDSGSVDWKEFTGEELNWLPEITIEVGSFTKPRRDEEVQKAAMALQMGLQALPAVPNLQISVLLRKVYEALEITEIGKIIDTEQDEAMLQAVEAVLILSGQDIPPKPGENHAVHIRVVDMILNSDRIGDYDPVAVDRLAQHRDGHEQLLEQLTTSLPGGNPVVAANNPFEMSNPANIARSDTAREREAIPAIPGSGGMRV